MDLSEIITELQNSHCRQCKIGMALIALKGIDEEPKVAGPESKLQRKTAVSKPKPAIKNSQGKAKPAGRGKNGDTFHAVLEYLAHYPNNKTLEIAKGTGLGKAAVSFHLSRARKQGVVVNSGNRMDSRWSMAKPGNNIRENIHEPDPERFDDEGDELVCKLCKSPAASKERLERHMRVVHGKV